MQSKFAYVYLGFCTFLSVVIGAHAVKYGSYGERDGYSWPRVIERDKDYYDEEMAVRLAAAMEWGIEDMELQGIPADSVEVVYNYPTHEWLVIFQIDDPEWNGIIIGVKRDDGTIEYYGAF